MLIFVVILNKN